MASKVSLAVRKRTAPPSDSSPPRTARVGPLVYSFTRAVQDWWYDLIPFAALNLLWMFMVITVVAGPPATAAMLLVARDAAVGEGAEPRNFFIYLKQYFWRAWKFGLVSLLGTVILVTDARFYFEILSGNPGLLNISLWLVIYVFLLWLEFLLIAWPVLVDQPDMPIRHVMRNSAILMLRYPGANLGLALIVFFLTILSIPLAVLLALASAAIISLMVQHYLHLQAPVLANFPLRPGEGAVPPENDPLVG